MTTSPSTPGTLLIERTAHGPCTPALHVFRGTWQYAITPDWLKCECGKQTWGEGVAAARLRFEREQPAAHPAETARDKALYCPAERCVGMKPHYPAGGKFKCRGCGRERKA